MVFARTAVVVVRTMHWCVCGVCGVRRCARAASVRAGMEAGWGHGETRRRCCALCNLCLVCTWCLRDMRSLWCAQCIGVCAVCGGSFRARGHASGGACAWGAAARGVPDRSLGFWSLARHLLWWTQGEHRPGHFRIRRPALACVRVRPWLASCSAPHRRRRLINGATRLPRRPHGRPQPGRPAHVRRCQVR